LATAQLRPAVLHLGTETGLISSRDDGRSWQENAALGRVRVQAIGIDPTDPGTLYVATTDSVQRSTDAGQSWQAADEPPDEPIRTIIVDPSRQERVYAAGAGLWRSNDAGRTWRSLPGVRGDILQLMIDPVSPAVLYASARNQGLFRSDNGGDSWTVIQPIESFGFVVMDGNTDIITANDSYMRRSRDGGSTWERLGSDIPGDALFALGKFAQMGYRGELRAFDTSVLIHGIGAYPQRPDAYYIVLTFCVTSFGADCGTGLLRYINGSWTAAGIDAADVFAPAVAVAPDGSIYAATASALHRADATQNSWRVIRQVGSRLPSLAVEQAHARLRMVRNSATPAVEGPLAPGTVVSLFGDNLAASTLYAPDAPFPIKLGDAEVIVDGIPARIQYASPSLVNAVLPENLTVGEVSVEVRVGGRRSVPRILAITSSAPALFTADGSGSGVGRLFDGVTFRPVTVESPAERGTVVVAYGTGLGRAAAVVVTIGGVEIRPDDAGLAPGFDGVFQLSFRVPEALQPGVHLMRVRAGTAASNNIQVPVK
jgi:uncharacterized protein (TIGR03437 family)